MTAALAVVCGILVLVASGPLRTIELHVTGVVVSWVVGQTGLANGPHIVYFHTAHLIHVHGVATRTVGLEITASCSGIFLIVPFFFLGGVMAFIPRVRLPRLFLGTALGAASVFLLNQLRLLIIAVSTWRWGISTGFDWSHILAGGVVTTIGVLIGLFLFFRFALAGRRWAPAPLSS